MPPHVVSVVSSFRIKCGAYSGIGWVEKDPKMAEKTPRSATATQIEINAFNLRSSRTFRVTAADDASLKLTLSSTSRYWQS